METVAEPYASTKGAAKVFPLRVFVAQEMGERGWTRIGLAKKLRSFVARGNGAMLRRHESDEN